MNTLTCNFEPFKKQELRELADRLLEHDPIAIEWCVAFVEVETQGLWHGRARAMMTRRLKHCRLSDRQRNRLLQAILERLISGTFSEQFKDQMRLALHLDPKRACAVARSCEHAPAAHVRRYAAWLLSRKAATAGTEEGSNKKGAS